MLPRIHCITDSPCPQGESLAAVVEVGVDAIQVRAEHLTDRGLFAFTRQVIDAVRPRGALVIVNDRLDIALAAGADGVHLGLDDLPIRAAREMAPDGFLIGGTCRNVGQALEARNDGADYAGVGPVYPSTTKQGLPDPVGLTTVAAVSRVLPAIAVSGITAARVPDVISGGAHGVAVIAGVWRAAAPAEAAREIVEAVKDATAGKVR